MTTLAFELDERVRLALTTEMQLECKPGLVCPSDNGSHKDMNQATFERSIFALQGYFADCFLLGQNHAVLAELKARGQQAEAAMFKATDGVNTHKGAIFMLGLLCAALGLQKVTHGRFRPARLGEIVKQAWGIPVLLSGAAHAAVPSHGLRVHRTLGLPGAREQAAAGFPVLFNVCWPALQHALDRGCSESAAASHALLSSMAVLDDTNLAHRGGLEGLRWAQASAAGFLAQGSVFESGWEERLRALCKAFQQRWLSPGGSADLLSAALFLQGLHQDNPLDLLAPQAEVRV
ncbi:triphosphoribosyl-dephospho-CoA synthase [Limnobacter litoralis]|uniref:triphosphoribosyl-dephospho-CoA synthase n=1 Tax=Limnobacter litoralis TaxID=481366 RepID=A0ABQ5YSQ4_9BURK|nr:triphosphoribosyl-dephospho-CoA synthase [Limnobacter litoralis]GLR27533.1 putative 2-(5''-triphosphoribosyl)-3'-dephosphocoenzyme-A synthase [Limnobacter litoralis]